MKPLSPNAALPALLAGLLVLLLTIGSASRSSAADTNTIQSIKTVAAPGGPRIEITLNSTRPFDVRNDALVLQIGASIFFLSRSPADGSLNTVIFTLTPWQFSTTKTGESVIAYFESSTPTGSDAWNFGGLNKKLLK